MFVILSRIRITLQVKHLKTSKNQSLLIKYICYWRLFIVHIVYNTENNLSGAGQRDTRTVACHNY